VLQAIEERLRQDLVDEAEPPLALSAEADPVSSICTGIIRTVKHGMIERRLGALQSPDLEAITCNLRWILGL
jgi:hypothetical protein